MLDDVGWKILEELQCDARLSYSELGRRVGLTAPAVAERVRRMEETGIISGYVARVDPARVGLMMTVFLRLRFDGPCHIIAQHIEEANDLPEVLECHRLTGEDSIMVKAVVRSVDHLGSLHDRLVRYGNTTTAIVLESRIVDRPITPDTLGETS